jgi:hypothetical protein
MMSLDGGHYYDLDPTGTYIWSRLERAQRVGDLAEHLAQSFDVRPEQCQAELLDFLNDLHGRKLLIIHDEEHV